MFIGHFGVGFGAISIAPKVSLGSLFLAAQFIEGCFPEPWTSAFPELLRTFLRRNHPQDFDQVAGNGGKIGIFSESYADTTFPRYFVYA